MAALYDDYFVTVPVTLATIISTPTRLAEDTSSRIPSVRGAKYIFTEVPETRSNDMTQVEVMPERSPVALTCHARSSTRPCAPLQVSYPWTCHRRHHADHKQVRYHGDVIHLRRPTKRGLRHCGLLERGLSQHCTHILSSRHRQSWYARCGICVTA